MANKDDDFDLFKKRMRGFFVAKPSFPLDYSPLKFRRLTMRSMMRASSPVEAVVKVASFIKTAREAKNALVYIAKTSEGLDSVRDVFDDERRLVCPKDFDREITHFNLKNRRKDGREMVHFIVSFPRKMNLREQQIYPFLEKYMEPFAQEGFRYTFAVHDHQGALHGHVLLCLSNGRSRLSFRKRQLEMLRMRQACVAQEFGWDIQATRCPSQEFSIESMTSQKVRKKTLLERQVPQWYAKRQNEQRREAKGLPLIEPSSAADFDGNKVLKEWSCSFDNPMRAVRLFGEMFEEKPRTAFWYANNRPEIFGEIIAAPRIKLTQDDIRVKAERINEPEKDLI